MTQKPEALKEKIKKLASCFLFFFNAKLKDKWQCRRKCLQLKLRATLQRPKSLGGKRNQKKRKIPGNQFTDEKMTCEHKRMLNFIYDKKN